MKNKLKKEARNTALLFRSIPSIVVVFFVVSVVLMNLLSNKEFNIPVDWLALDCGYIMSWLAFLCMDIITKRFGAKAAIIVSVFALCVNLLCCGVFTLIAFIPGTWAVSYDLGQVANYAIDGTIGGTWYVVCGSALAFLVSAVVNAFVNEGIGKLFNHTNFKEYAIRSFASTMIGQFVDNFIFSFVVCHTFFGWSMLQVVTCSLTGCIIELLCEVIFSPIGYRVCKRWESNKIGEEYLRAIQ